MSNVKIKLNSAGIIELLKSPEISGAVNSAGSAILNNLGAGYTIDSRAGKKRHICRVAAESNEAKRDCYKNNTLLKAVHK